MVRIFRDPVFPKSLGEYRNYGRRSDLDLAC